jgi:hypothetical protein
MVHGLNGALVHRCRCTAGLTVAALANSLDLVRMQLFADSDVPSTAPATSVSTGAAATTRSQLRADQQAADQLPQPNQRRGGQPVRMNVMPPRATASAGRQRSWPSRTEQRSMSKIRAEPRSLGHCGGRFMPRRPIRPGTKAQCVMRPWPLDRSPLALKSWRYRTVRANSAVPDVPGAQEILLGGFFS